MSPEEELQALKEELNKICDIHRAFLPKLFDSFKEFIKMQPREYITKDELQSIVDKSIEVQHNIKKLNENLRGVKDALIIYQKAVLELNDPFAPF